MQRLTNLDASFLHLESARAPMHVGAVMIFEPPKSGPMTFERFRAHVQSRLPTARVFRQRLFMPPYQLDNPWWVEDADFALDRHLARHRVTEPLGAGALEGLSAEFFSHVLPRDRPLWEMLYVDHADPAAGFAVLLKIHHAALDGLSAEAVITGLLDDTESPAPAPLDAWKPEVLPELATTLLRRVEAAKQLEAWGTELFRTATRLTGVFVERLTSPIGSTLPHYWSAPPTPFNVPIGAERSYASAQLSLRQIKRIKEARPGLTVNDVVLAICAEATRRYLEDEGVLPEEPLVAMAPISRRAQQQKHTLGNEVAAMLIGLATDVADPVERLQQIHDNAAHAKAYSREMTAEKLLDQLPSSGPALVLSSFARLRIARHLPPLFNFTVTNVPGSPVPLYLDGAMLTNMTGMAGVFDGLGLTIVVLSYCDTLSISLTSAPEAMKDARRLVGYIEGASDALEEAVVRPTEKIAARATYSATR